MVQFLQIGLETIFLKQKFLFCSQLKFQTIQRIYFLSEMKGILLIVLSCCFEDYSDIFTDETRSPSSNENFLLQSKLLQSELLQTIQQ